MRLPSRVRMMTRAWLCSSSSPESILKEVSGETARNWGWLRDGGGAWPRGAFRADKSLPSGRSGLEEEDEDTEELAVRLKPPPTAVDPPEAALALDRVETDGVAVTPEAPA